MKSDHLSISRVGQINSDDKDTYRLAFTRSLMTPEHEADFALGYATTVESSEYNDAIELVTMQECRMAKPKPLSHPKTPKTLPRVTVTQNWTPESARRFLEGMARHEAELIERKARKEAA